MVARSFSELLFRSPSTHISLPGEILSNSSLFLNMYLTERSRVPSFSPFRAFGKRSKPFDFDFVARSFDEKVLHRLKLLSPPSASVSWFSLAVDFLSFTHTESKNLISTLKSSPSGESFDVYLNYSMKLLDICNSITSEIEKLNQRRLSVCFVLHLLEISGVDHPLPPLEKIRRARDSLSSWDCNSRVTDRRSRFQIQDPDSLIRELASELANPPHGKISSVEKLIYRTIYAVGLVTVYVAGVVLSAVHGIPKTTSVRAPAEFLWADSFNSLEEATCSELNRRVSVGGGKGTASFDEIDDVATRLRRLLEVIDGVVLVDKDKEEVKKERLEVAVKDLTTVTSRFEDGLDCLANGVNGLFNAVLGTRNGLLDSYRVGPEKCSKRKL